MTAYHQISLGSDLRLRQLVSESVDAIAEWCEERFPIPELLGKSLLVPRFEEVIERLSEELLDRWLGSEVPAGLLYRLVRKIRQRS
jgi:hypothetical protein